MSTNPQAMTFQKININVYHQHKSDQRDHEILLYHVRGRCAMNMLNTLPVYYFFKKIYNLFLGGNSSQKPRKLREAVAIRGEVLCECCKQNVN